MISNVQQSFDNDILENFLNSDKSGLIITNTNGSDKSQGNNNSLQLPRIIKSTVIQQTLDETTDCDPSLICLHHNNSSSENAKENINIMSQSNLMRNDIRIENNFITTNPSIIIMNNNNNNNSKLESAFKTDNSHKKSINCNNDDTNATKTITISKNCSKNDHDTDNSNNLPLRNESQEYAFLQIEQVHNYSKASRIGGGQIEESTNSSSQDDEDDDCEFENREQIKNTDVNELKIKDNCNSFHHIKIEYNDDDDDDEDDTFYRNDDTTRAINSSNVPECGGGDDDDGKIAPDHHARRPMNAFLIFCKRHRAIVREKYKNLENRSITKILGDWWATLGTEEKSCYTNLAKQYKDAFFSANPNFKWYKLPAPPLRTLNTRPSNLDRSSAAASINYVQENDNYEKITSTNKDLLNYRGNRSSTVISNHEKDNVDNSSDHHHSYHHVREKYSNVGIFKLADETQMGGLNNLITNDKQLKNSLNSSDSTKELMTTSSEIMTIKIVNEDNKEGVFINDTYCMVQDPFNQVKDAGSTEINQTEKRKAIDDGNMNETKRINYDFNSINPMTDDEDKRKSARACKGKKYQEFINSGQIIPFIKKLKPKSTSHYHASAANSGYFETSDGNQNSKYEMSEQYENSTMKLRESDDVGADKIYGANGGGSNNNNTELSLMKQFNASDFDLEEKIKALPAQNLDKYLQRKRDTKKKKKFSSKRQNSKNVAKNNNKSSSNNKIITMEDVRDNNLQKSIIVGSQKRKARKESITRRDINAINNEQQQQQQQQNTCNVYETVESLVQLSSMDNNVINITKSDDDQQEIDDNLNNDTKSHTTNLHLLNILAEVATNHIRDDTT